MSKGKLRDSGTTGKRDSGTTEELDTHSITIHHEPAMRKRTYPTEELTDTRETKRGSQRETLPDGLLDMSPALRKDELSELEAEMINATPEQFQQMLGKMYRIMLVRGLKDVPRPKSIKEIQALNDMIRRSEGVEARERGGGTPAGGFLPRVVGRKKVMAVDTGEVVEATVVEIEEATVVEPTPDSVNEPAPEMGSEPTPEPMDEPSGDPTPEPDGFF